jgi:hypothetical protein
MGEEAVIAVRLVELRERGDMMEEWRLSCIA